MKHMKSRIKLLLFLSIFVLFPSRLLMTTGSLIKTTCTYFYPGKLDLRYIRVILYNNGTLAAYRSENHKVNTELNKGNESYPFFNNSSKLQNLHWFGGYGIAFTSQKVSNKGDFIESLKSGTCPKYAYNLDLGLELVDVKKESDKTYYLITQVYSSGDNYERATKDYECEYNGNVYNFTVAFEKISGNNKVANYSNTEIDFEEHSPTYDVETTKSSLKVLEGESKSGSNYYRVCIMPMPNEEYCSESGDILHFRGSNGYSVLFMNSSQYGVKVDFDSFSKNDYDLELMTEKYDLGYEGQQYRLVPSDSTAEASVSTRCKLKTKIENEDNQNNLTGVLEDNCDSILGSEAIDFINDIYKLVKIAVPIIVLVLTSFDFFKAIYGDEADAMQKAFKTFKKRIILLVVIFMVPVLVGIIFDLLSSFGVFGSSDVLCGIK